MNAKSTLMSFVRQNLTLQWLSIIAEVSNQNVKKSWHENPQVQLESRQQHLRLHQVQRLSEQQQRLLQQQLRGQRQVQLQHRSEPLQPSHLPQKPPD